MYKSKDHYFHKAKKEGYPARSVYKLEQIDQRYRLIKPGYRILDLGCYPGSWLKYCAKRVGRGGLVLGIDIKKISPLPFNARFIQADINQLPIEQIKEIADSFDVVLSDMAPATTGIKPADEQASLALAECALDLAQKLLRPQGNLLVKVFEGEDLKQLRDKIEKQFDKVHIIRPKAIRKGSREVYLLGLGKPSKLGLITAYRKPKDF